MFKWLEPVTIQDWARVMLICKEWSTFVCQKLLLDSTIILITHLPVHFLEYFDFSNVHTVLNYLLDLGQLSCFSQLSDSSKF